MKYLADAAMAKECDRRTIEEAGIPSLVLMERAALGIAETVKNEFSIDKKIISVCGTGNNGADGAACARILKEEGYDTHILYIGDIEKATPEFVQQLRIAKACGVSVTGCAKPKTDPADESRNILPDGYDVIIDALFGIGLSRELQGIYAQAVNAVNKRRAEDDSVRVISVDIPSGVSTGAAVLTGPAVKADLTVTFGSLKTGLVLGRGAGLCKRVICKDCGFSAKVMREVLGKYFYYEKNELKDILPRRKMISHKGTYGKICVVAGKRLMSGAAGLCAAAALKSGAGMVKVISDIENAGIILSAKPELMFDAYNDNEGNIDSKALDRAIGFADIIAVGPGLGTDERACEIFDYIIDNTTCPLVIDADGINILAGKNEDYLNKISGRSIITPHIAEMSRLTGKSVEKISEDTPGTALGFARARGIITVLKDFRTVVSDGEKVYVNMAGNNGMATAGCGDVLCGIIASMCAQGQSLFEGAVSGCFLHSTAADSYAGRYNGYALNASDIINELKSVM